MKRIWIVAVLIVGFFLGALTVWYAQNQPSVARADEVKRQVMPVQMGDIVRTIQSTGHLEAKGEIELGFEIDGVVEEVLVKRSQKVEGGQLLARLDKTKLDQAVIQAEISLDNAKAELAALQDNIDPYELASARADLASAQARYDRLLAGSGENEITIAEASLRTAELALEDATGAYEQVAWIGGYKILSEQQALQEAQIDYATALANYNLAVKGADNEELKAAEADIASAQAALNNLLRGASDEEIALAESKVKAAQLSLDGALRDLEDATLVAPIDATVTAVNIHRGERTRTGSSSNVAIVLTDLSELHIDVQIDEIDVPSVKAGQAAVVKVDALPGQPLSGMVARVASMPVSVGDGVVTYETAVRLHTQHEKARPGMTSNVEIETERREGVLLIPSSVVQVDATTAQTFVEKQGADGQAVRVDVTLGTRSGQMIEVQSGLQMGDLVVMPMVTTVPQTTVERDNRGMPMPPMMMGGPPGGGGGPPGGGGGRNSIRH